MKIKVSLQNSGGELDCRIVDSEEAARNAAIEIIAGMNDLHIGDKIIISADTEEG